MPATKDVSTNIRNLAHGRDHAKRVRDQGKAGARKQEVAIGYAEARRARKRTSKTRKARGRG